MNSKTLTMETRQKEGAILKAHLQRAKEAEKLTQAELASDIGVTQSLIGQWIRGDTPIPDHRLFQLAKRLKFDAIETRPALAKYLDTADVKTTANEALRAFRGKSKPMMLERVTLQNIPDSDRYLLDIDANTLEIYPDGATVFVTPWNTDENKKYVVGTLANRPGAMIFRVWMSPDVTDADPYLFEPVTGNYTPSHGRQMYKRPDVRVLGQISAIHADKQLDNM